MYYKVIFAPQRKLIMFRGKTQDGLWQAVAHGSRRRLPTQMPQALREYARKPQAGQKRPWSAKDVLSAELFDHVDGKLDMECDEKSEDSEGDEAPDEFKPQETGDEEPQYFRHELYQALAESKATARALLRSKHILELEALMGDANSANVKPVGVLNAAPVVPVAPANVVSVTVDI